MSKKHFSGIWQAATLSHPLWSPWCLLLDAFDPEWLCSPGGCRTSFSSHSTSVTCSGGFARHYSDQSLCEPHLPRGVCAVPLLYSFTCGVSFFPPLPIWFLSLMFCSSLSAAWTDFLQAPVYSSRRYSNHTNPVFYQAKLAILKSHKDGVVGPEEFEALVLFWALITARLQADYLFCKWFVNWIPGVNNVLCELSDGDVLVIQV